MAAAYHEPVLLDATVNSDSGLHISATRSEDARRLVIHIVNPDADGHEVKLDLAGVETVGDISGLVLSSDSLTDRNTPQEPEKVVPQPFTASSTSLTLKPYSYTVVSVSCTP